MKGLNVKRLAAIGVGAALVGSALAPIVSAVSVSQISKSNIINTATGQPIVGVAVGSKAKASDVVWAGNIAARVAQLATVEKDVTVQAGEGSGEGATVSDLSVDLTVGGTVKVSGGVRELLTANMNSGSSQWEYRTDVGNAYFKSFKNESKQIKINNDTNTTTVVESIGVKLDALFDTTNVSVKDLVGYISSGDLNYQVTFSPGIPYFTDSGADDYVPISFLGKTYVVDSINTSGTQIVLVSTSAEKVYQTGDRIALKGRDGKDYSLELRGGYTSSGTTYAKVALLDADGTELQVQSVTNDDQIDTVFSDTDGKAILETKVTMKRVGTNTVDNTTTYDFTLLVGSDRLDIRNGNRFPYDPNNTSGSYPWQAALTTSGTTLTAIAVTNNAKIWNASNPLTATGYTLGNVTTGVDKAGILEGSGLDPIGYVKFKGFYDQGVQKTTVKFLKGQNVADISGGSSTYGAIQYKDTSSVEHKIPMAIKLGQPPISGNLKFEGQDYTYAVGKGDSGAGTSGNRFILEPGQVTYSTSAQITGDFNFAYGIDNVPAATADENWSGTGDINNLASGNLITITGKNSKTYKYFFKTTTSAAWLVLAGYDINGTTSVNGYIDTLEWSTGGLFLLGTDVSDNDNVTTSLNDYNLSQAQQTSVATASFRGVSYYAPDTADFGTYAGSAGGIYKTAVFFIRELDTNTAIPHHGGDAPNVRVGVWTIYIDTEGGNAGTVDTANNNKTNYAGKTTAADYNAERTITTLSEYTGSSTNFTKGYDDNGIKVELASRELSFVLPNSRMKSYWTVESLDTTEEVSGGATLAGVLEGATAKTDDGTTVTVDKVNYTVAGGAGGAVAVPAKYNEIVKTGNLVYTDAGFNPSGNAIIVGGYKVNTLAKGLQLDDGTTLEDALTARGDKVAELLNNGDIVAAGYTADDTAAAAQELISALDGLLA
ncbi:MAG: S-layer protein [Candidatus Diapherotrites archaeon]|nr:S-layer protein [Candidatus Diapherotrites archaeon]